MTLYRFTSIAGTTWMITTTLRYKRAYIHRVQPNNPNDYFLQFKTCSQWIDNDFVISPPLKEIFFCAITTTSSPLKSIFLWRKLSLIRRLILFRFTTLLILLLDMAKPRRAIARPLRWAKTRKLLSTDRKADRKTFWKSKDFVSLLVLWNRLVWQGTLNY